MARVENNQHPSAEEIADYFGGGLPLQRETALDVHFSGCDACAEIARRVRLLSCLLTRWTADAHRNAAEESRLLNALERACEEPSCAQWRERLRRWMENWHGKSEAALRIALRRTKESIQVNISSFAALTRPGALWPEFAPQAAMATRGTVEAAEAVVSCSGEAPRDRVAARPTEGIVQVEIEGATSDLTRLVMLMPDDPAAQPLLAQLRPGPQPECFVAVFEPVAAGSYTLVIEPSEPTHAPPVGGSSFL